MYMLQILKLPIAKTNTLSYFGCLYTNVFIKKVDLFRVKHEILISSY